MVEIHHEGSCEAPVAVAFAYVDDYRNTTKWMFGLAEFVPQGELDHGLGSVFRGTFQVKPVKLHSTVECTGWKQDELIAFESIEGFKNSSVWTFIPDGPDRTKVDVRFSYELPGGLAGRALGRALEPIVAMSLRHTDEALRKQIEEQHAAG
jgi:uncharacterized membrane protein